MSDPEDFITGIFNYCDRWCDRCPFISRCRVGVNDREFRRQLEEDGIAEGEGSEEARNAAFVKHLGDSLEQTKELLMRMAAERGIDLEAAMAEDAAKPRKLRLPAPDRRRVLRQAKAYFKKVDAWLDSNQELLKTKEQELISADQIGLPGADPEAEAVAITDALQVIRWYSPQIYVKLQRASRRDEDEDDPELAEVDQYDQNGSAKVALIGMDRCLAAWGRLYEEFLDAQDVILDILVHLDRLRRDTEKVFPDARAFVRPGFDEPA